MFPLERIKIIKKYLLDNQKAEVAYLSELLDVSEVTIRRDLEKLEQERFLTRTHGGAVLSRQENAIPPPPEVEDPYLKERQDISDMARHLIEDNDVIMFTQGITNLQIARNLDKIQKLTVLTNDLLIALELSRYPDMKVILLGGDMGLHSKAVYGQMAINSLQNFFVKKIFIEADGLDLEHGLTVSSIERANLIAEAMKRAENRIVLCRGSAVGEKAFFPVCPINRADSIITNTFVPDSFKDGVYQQNIKLYTSVRVYEGSH